MNPIFDHTLPLEERVKYLLEQMTLEEKVGLLPAKQAAIPRLDIGEYLVGAEGAHGLLVRTYYEQWPGGNSTVFPQPIGMSCTWDKDLLFRIGDVISTEARIWYEKHEHRQWLTLWFPTIDMERDPRWGRNEEAYGEDPHLAGKLAASLIRGVQGDHPYYLKTSCAPKHFYGNNVEKNRGSTSTNLTERLKHEYYLKVFKYAFVEGRAHSLMTAYNEINGVPCIGNPENLTLVKGEWGCDGHIVSDGDDLLQTITLHKYCETPAQAITLALKNGVDCFPEQKTENVTNAALDAVKEGLLTEEDIDRAVGNTLRSRFRLGQFDPDKVNPYSKISKDKLCGTEHSAVALEAAQKAVVLLKNDGMLPLNAKGRGGILMLGDLAENNLPDWYSGKPPHVVTPLSAIRKKTSKSKVKALGVHDLCVLYSNSNDAWLRVGEKGTVSFDGDEDTRSVFEEIDWGFNAVSYRDVETKKYLNLINDPNNEGGFTLACTADAVWGWFTMEQFMRDEITGKLLPNSHTFGTRYKPEECEKIDALMTNLRSDIITNAMAPIIHEAKKTETVIITLGNHPLINGRECFDRPSINFPKRWERLINSVCDVNDNVILVLIAGYPYAFPKFENLFRAILYTAHGEQDVGSGLADVIFGDYNPAGRTSMTWYLSENDLPDINDYDIINKPRTYMYFEKPVQFPFGHGLSYTTFEYSNLKATPKGEGYAVTCDVTNIGKADGDEVVQLYLTLLGTPIKAPVRRLCGFERINLQKGETKSVAFEVSNEYTNLYDEEGGAFTVKPQSIIFAAGASSKDIRVSTTV
ncbi:MAG: glycoside hydrolase family 3 C-terminal domain-containing protein [Oscillospiraceae bacterium]|nr:glycoside hydrolase family 3 C-terminal domain-containing protein [Oscillospiraceae bacterium]